MWQTLENVNHITYVTLNPHHVAAQMQVHVVRQKHVAVRYFSVPSHGLSSRGLLGVDQTYHVHWRVELQLGLVIILLVVLFTLQSGHLHVVDQQGVILEAAVANVVAFCLLISQLILVLHTKKNLIKLSKISNS